MRIGSKLGALAMVAVVVAAFAARPAEAQVAAADGQAFVGKWALAFQPMGGGAGGAGGGPPGGGAGGARPGGGGGAPGAGAGGGPGGGGRGGAQVLDITVANGQLAAALTGGMGAMGGGQTITNISRSGQTLVLTYTMAMGGQSVPATLTLTPDGAAMKAEMVVADRMTRTGTATKQP